MRAAAALIALLMFGALIPRARAREFSIKGFDFNLDLTNTSIYTYHFDNGNSRKDDDKYHHVFNTLDLSLSHGDYRLGGRFDLNVFANTPFDQHCPDTNLTWCEQAKGLRYETQFAPEKLYFIVARPEFDLTAGDFYASFGKGMALNVVKIGELSQDTTIQGGKLEVHHGNLGLTLLGGVINPLDVDAPTGWSGPWDSGVLGVRLEYNILGRVLVGSHGVFVGYPGEEVGHSFGSLGGHHDAVWGAGVEVPDLFDGLLSFSGEIDLEHSVNELGKVTRGPGGEGDFKGMAGYASATLQLGELNLLTEYKYYDDFLVQNPIDSPYRLYYHQPPTLERLTAEISNNTKISGARLRADYNLGALGPVELLVFANFGYFEGWPEANEASRIWNPFAGLELQWQDGVGHLEASGGLRREESTEEGSIACHGRGKEPPCLHYQDAHAELTLEQGVLSNHSLKLYALVLNRVRQLALKEDKWIELQVELSYKWSPHLSVAFTYEYQGDDSQDQGDPHYPGGSVRYFFNPGTYLDLWVGENRPGIKCINGVCRSYPAFSGARLTAVVRF